MPSEIVQPNQQSVGELRQWLSKFSETQQEHYEKNRVRSNVTAKDRIRQFNNYNAERKAAENAVPTVEKAPVSGVKETASISVNMSNPEKQVAVNTSTTNDDHHDDEKFRVVTVSEKALPISETPSVSSSSWSTSGEWSANRGPVSVADDASSWSSNEDWMSDKVDQALSRCNLAAEKPVEKPSEPSPTTTTVTAPPRAVVAEEATRLPRVTKRLFPTKSAVRQRMQALQRKWAEDKVPSHTRKVEWTASSTGKYKKKVSLNFEEVNDGK